MAFRAEDASRERLGEMLSYFVPLPRDLSADEREKSRQVIFDLEDELGPAVEGYPSWHPLVRHHDEREPCTIPGTECGYVGLDHTRYFRNGFVTCPYTASGKAEQVIKSVASLPSHPIASITAEKLDVTLYSPLATPVVVKCVWSKRMEADGMIPLSVAMPLLLEQELPCWRWSELAETWETMRPYFLGRPHGSRSSLFVSQETGQSIKKIWSLLIYTGMFGPIKV